MEPIYKIHGATRRALKNKLAQLRSTLRTYWYYHQLDKDMASFYGTSDNGFPMGDEAARIRFAEIESDANNLASLLAEPYKRPSD